MPVGQLGSDCAVINGLPGIRRCLQTPFNALICHAGPKILPGATFTNILNPISYLTFAILYCLSFWAPLLFHGVLMRESFNYLMLKSFKKSLFQKFTLSGLTFPLTQPPPQNFPEELGPFLFPFTHQKKSGFFFPCLLLSAVIILPLLKVLPTHLLPLLISRISIHQNISNLPSISLHHISG